MKARVRSFPAVRQCRPALALLLTLPTVIMIVSPAEVILIHAHGVSPIHHHASTLSDLADARAGHHHPHGDGHDDDHESQAPVTDDGTCTLLIVFKAPMTAKPLRYSHPQVATAASLHSPGSAHPLGIVATSPLFRSPAFPTLAPPLRADGALMGLLLSSHALLL